MLPAVLALPAPVPAGFTALEIREDTSQTSSLLSLFNKRQSCAETCGNVCYYQSTIDRAVAAGYQLYQDGEEKGGYPHTYNNYEGFDFPVSGPYQEYPVLSSFQAYDGGSPGADRVVFNTQGAFAGAITHTGASGNNFVDCE